MRILLIILIVPTLALAALAVRGGSVIPAPAARPAPAGPRPNVIMISVDTVRADHLGCYGYSRDTSPNLDRLAGRSVRFANAFAQASWTLPSHMSMMTSQYPHVHGVQSDEQALPESATTLAEVLSGAGYETAALISWVYVTEKFGFAQGFERFKELLPPPHMVDSGTSAAYRAEEVTDQAIDWLKRAHDRPFFLFLHYFDPHINYEPPAPYDTMFDPNYKGRARGTFDWIAPYIKGLHQEAARIAPLDMRHLVSLYDGEIRYTDQHLGRLLDALDRTVGLDKCLIVFTSDHGEEFAEHGSMEGHQWTLYDEVVHVPLIIHPPGGRQGGAVVEQPVELIDIAATVLGQLGIAAPTAFQGEDLSPWLCGTPQPDPSAVVFGEIDRFNRKQYVRMGGFKLIHTDDVGLNKRGVAVQAGFEMYDIRDDPGERRNVFDAGWPLAQSLVRELESRKAAPPDGSGEHVARTRVQLSHGDTRRLRSLGYVETSPSP